MKKALLFALIAFLVSTGATTAYLVKTAPPPVAAPDSVAAAHDSTAADAGAADSLAARDSTAQDSACLLYTSPSPRDRTRSRMPSSA